MTSQMKREIGFSKSEMRILHKEASALLRILFALRNRCTKFASDADKWVILGESPITQKAMNRMQTNGDRLERDVERIAKLAIDTLMIFNPMREKYARKVGSRHANARG